MLIAVVTYEARGSYSSSNVLDEDELLGNILKELNVEFNFEIWSDPKVNWEKYSHLLMKSPWDYFDRYKDFLSWCSKIKKTGIPVFNDIQTVIWNSDKKYLKEVQEKGFHIVPTHFFERGNQVDLTHSFESFGAENLVFKPTVSGGAKNTIKLGKADWKSRKAKLEALLKHEDFMVQPFIEEVVQTGEYSYVFFNNRFSHAVLKSPKAGEFRVQHFFGGGITKVHPDKDHLDYLQNPVSEFAGNCLYARVDGVWIEGAFYLMELELIEPYLFLFTDPKAVENYKNAIKEKLGLA